MNKIRVLKEDEIWKAIFPKDNIFYEEEYGILYLGNVVEILEKFYDKTIDLVVTSPPYGSIRDYEGKILWNFEIFKEVAFHLARVLKPGGIIVWIVADQTINGSETGDSFRQALYFKELGLKLHDTMIYLKDSFAFPDSNRYRNVFEYMFVFSNGRPKTVNLITDRENKYGGQKLTGTERQSDGTLKKKSSKARVKEYGVRFNVWRYPVGKYKTTKDEFAYEHPAMFPEDLARDHIVSWSNEGDIVLDPLCGAGTTLKMAKMLKRRFIGIDIVPKYIEIAKRRLQNVTYGELVPSIYKELFKQ